MAELLGKKARAPKGYREGREKGRDKMGTKRATLISELISNNNDWACVCVCAISCKWRNKKYRHCLSRVQKKGKRA